MRARVDLADAHLWAALQDVLLLIPAGCVLFFIGPVYTIASSTTPTTAGAELTARLLGMNRNQFGFSILVPCAALLASLTPRQHHTLIPDHLVRCGRTLSSTTTASTCC